MQLVAGIGKFDHVRYRLRGGLRLALDQQISLLMLVAQKPRGGGVTLAKDQMSADAKTRAAPCVNEQIGLVPAVKADAERGGFQNTVHLCEGRFQPARVIVIGNAAAGTVG